MRSWFYRLSLIGLGAMAAAVLLAETAPANAQGGIVCEFGSTLYRRCCTESYRRSPNLGARARANDIDACVNRGSKGSAGDNQPSGRGSDRDRSRTGSTIRRVDCGSRGCSDGCAADEVAIGAFCGIGEFPTPNGDRDVECASNSGTRRPTMLICAGGGR